MKKRLLALIAAATLLLSAGACSKAQDSKDSSRTASAVSTVSDSSEQKASQPENKTTSLEYWTEDSPAMKSIMAYVSEVTDESSDKFVPAEKRLAVFDWDGTLYGELFPTYFDQCFMIHRLVHDETYEGNPEDTAYCKALEQYLLKGGDKPKAPRSSGDIIAEAFKGFTVEEAIVDATPVAVANPVPGDRYLTFVLDEPFAYEGGNLLVECKVIETEGDWGTTYFWVQGFDDYYPGLYSYQGYSGMVTYAVDYLPAATFTYDGGTEPGPGPDPEDPYAQGYWLMAINADGEVVAEVVPYQLMLGDNGDYTTTVKFGYNDFGTYDPETEERPAVPFYFIVNGVRYGAPEELVAATLGYALDNPLAAADGCYTVPVGFNYNIGIAFGLEGDMYAYVAQANATGIDELSGKAVSGVRYFNLAGQEMQQANGVTIVVTTYTDGTTSAVKVVK